jgi:hypothetical protein
VAISSRSCTQQYDNGADNGAAILLTKNENDLLLDIEKIAQLFYPSETLPRTIQATYLAAKQFGSDVYNIQRTAAWGDNFEFPSNVFTRDQQAVSALGSLFEILPNTLQRRVTIQAQCQKHQR